MRLATPESAILSAVIFNALIIVALFRLRSRVKYRPMGAEAVLRRNLWIYGFGGIVIPFVGIKIIDMIVHIIAAIVWLLAWLRIPAVAARRMPGDPGPALAQTRKAPQRRHVSSKRDVMNILKQIYPAFAITVALTVLLGIIYPLVVTGLAQLIFPQQAGGSLIEKDGEIVGSRLIGQPFSGPSYFHSRPSAAGAGYDAGASGGTNLVRPVRNSGNRVKTAAADHCELRILARQSLRPVTASASGLDPHITPAAAEFQVPRVASQRGLSQDDVRRISARA